MDSWYQFRWQRKRSAGFKDTRPGIHKMMALVFQQDRMVLIVNIESSTGRGFTGIRIGDASKDLDSGSGSWVFAG